MIGLSNTRSPLAVMMIGLIRLYRLVPKTRDHCRFHPTCSAYGLEAVKVHGAVKGTWLIMKRLGRCQPWGGTGIDPVPPTKTTTPSTNDRTRGVLASALVEESPSWDS